MKTMKLNMTVTETQTSLFYNERYTFILFLLFSSVFFVVIYLFLKCFSKWGYYH